MKLKAMIKVGVAALAPVAVAAAIAAPAMAAGGLDQIGQGANSANPGTGDNLNDLIGNIINTILYIVGLVTVAVIIYGGVRYTLSTGDPKKVTDAKNTIMYGIIGLVICILAYAIVNFVVDAF